MEFVLNVFTLNCWGIPVVSKNRKERYEAIAKYLSESSHTIVCLQEVWSEKDYLFLKETLKERLPYSHYFYSGVLGSGLCVFSKWMIQDVFFHQWPLNGYIHKIQHGDWFGGKGVGLCRIKVGESLVNIYCTHLHAEYHVDDMYLAHRLLQAYSTAEFINITSYPADVSVLAGDLNTGPGDIAFRMITSLPSLEDPYDMKCDCTDPSVVKQAGTCDNANNSYSDPGQVKINPDGKRIDHILFHTHPSWQATIKNFGNPLPDRVPDKPFSYSDHNGVSLEIALNPKDATDGLGRQTSKDGICDETISQAIKVCKDALKNLKKTKKLYLITGTLLFMFLLGTVGFFPNSVLFDVSKLIMTAFSLYYLVMGSIWNRIEVNSLKAGLSAMENFSATRLDSKAKVPEQGQQNPATEKVTQKKVVDQESKNTAVE